MDDKNFLCGGWSAEGVPTIYFLDAQRRLIPRLSVPTALFFNGITPLSNQVTPWFQHEFLTRIDPNKPMPAANGIKIHEHTVFVSNIARNTLSAIPLIAGEPAIYLDDINLDDFDIDPDGTIYATTHIFNSVIEIKRGQPASVIAGIEHGLAGSTAAQLGRTAGDRRTLYVTTNGGLSLPPAGGLEDGRR